uniref:Uncharacterized protein n=1 Tax=Anguilla anguilla TaxID=7936 RepID=A0A0E9U0R6_ANGAN
MAGGLGVGK